MRRAHLTNHFLGALQIALADFFEGLFKSSVHDVIVLQNEFVVND